MFCTLLACTCSVATAAVAPSGGWDGGALEEAVVDASCRVATVASAYRAATKVYSSSRRRAMAHTWARASAAWRVAILLMMRCYRATTSVVMSLAVSSPTIEGAWAVETDDPEER
jgi:hypothetical protein